MSHNKRNPPPKGKKETEGRRLNILGRHPGQIMAVSTGKSLLEVRDHVVEVEFPDQNV